MSKLVIKKEDIVKLIKKLLSSVTAIACGMSVMCGSSALLTASADGTYDKLTYVLWDGDRDGAYDYVEITDCDEYAINVEIPSKIEGLPVESIGFGAFRDCVILTSITIPDSVKSIESCAFSSCVSLESITIPDSVTSIGYDAFWRADFIHSQTGVKYADKWVVECDANVTSAELKAGTRGIAKDAFKGCTSLESITIPDGVTYINWRAFYECTSLKSITIPDSVTNMSSNVFIGCTSLESVIIPDSLTRIRELTFMDCKSLKSITIPKSITNIGNLAFSGCENLKSVIILNPDCEIYMNDETICNGSNEDSKAYYKGIIYGYADSTAQTYADEYNYKFLAINDYGVLGDADDDGKVTAKDSSLMFSEFKRIYRSEPSTFTEQQMKRCDLNGDGKITALDASKVFSIYKENYRRG